MKIKNLLKKSLGGFYYMLRTYYYRIKSKRKQKDYFTLNSEPKLNIGCNKNILDGWLNTDLFYNHVVTYLDAGKKFPFENKSFNYIYSEHLFEHLTYHQAINFLNESYRVLRKDGVIRIATPNLDFLFNIYSVHNDFNSEYIKWASNNSLSKINNEYFEEKEILKVFVINNFFKAWGHQIIHNYSSLKGMLAKAGFENINQVSVGKSDIEVFREIEKHGTVIPEIYNNFETIVVEATRKN